MARELKTEKLTIRIKPSTKALLEHLADDDDMSVGSLIDKLAKAEKLRRLR